MSAMSREILEGLNKRGLRARPARGGFLVGDRFLPMSQARHLTGREITRRERRGVRG